jgi:hypoxanthine phosphoribosyltransferase
MEAKFTLAMPKVFFASYGVLPHISCLISHASYLMRNLVTHIHTYKVHQAIVSLAPQIQEFKPDVIIAIGGGGYIPARMLRTVLKIPILAVSLELYNDATNSMNGQVQKVQWFDETSGVGATSVRGKRVLIVDEVDDTRTTLKFCVDEIRKTNAPAAIAVAVVHNKVCTFYDICYDCSSPRMSSCLISHASCETLSHTHTHIHTYTHTHIHIYTHAHTHIQLKPKKQELDADVVYMAGEDVPNNWNCYPWDAASYGNSILEHEALARKCEEGMSWDRPIELVAAALLGALCTMLIVQARR